MPPRSPAVGTAFDFQPAADSGSRQDSKRQFQQDMRIQPLVILLLTSLGMSAPALAGNPLVYEGTAGPGKGRHIVFLAGDHEYRSEESLPALARLLAKHHGFKCTVLFNVDPASGEIVPGGSRIFPPNR
jgi:hypothetical protein